MQFSVNPTRFDPYKNFKFRVKWDNNYVLGVSKMSALKRTTEAVKHREGGDPSSSRKSPGKTEFEAIYNVFGNHIGLSIGIKVDRNDPVIETITDIIPGAICYERELQDFFGFKVKNIPDGRRLIIPDKWPEGQYPLRKDWTKDMIPASFNDGLLRDWRK